MVDIVRPLDSFSSVGAGLTAVVAIPVGPTYEEIILDTDAPAADMTEVRLILNAEPIVAVPAQLLVDLETHKHGAPNANQFPISLRDLVMESFSGEENTALVTGPGDQLTLEVDVAGGSALTYMRGYSVTSGARPVRQVLPRLQRFSWVPAATGKQQLSTLVTGPTYRRMILGGDTGDHDEMRDLFESYEPGAGEAFDDSEISSMGRPATSRSNSSSAMRTPRMPSWPSVAKAPSSVAMVPILIGSSSAHAGAAARVSAALAAIRVCLIMVVPPLSPLSRCVDCTRSARVVRASCDH